jgi:hypothetical protein
VRGVVSAYLFGSHAAGREHRESDVDVAVLLDWNAHPTASARFEARLRFITHLGHALGSRAVDLVVLNDAPPHLTRRVMTEGRQIVNVDPELDHAARRTALLRAADLDPFLRRLRRINLQAMAR